MGDNTLECGDKVSDDEETDFIEEGAAKAFVIPKFVFYNPVQEFNRDLTVAVINTYCQSVLENDKTRVSGVTYDDGITILEPLAATGLRSCRFALEVAGLKYIVANDYNDAAVENMKKNIQLNNISHIIRTECSDASKLMQNWDKFGKFDVIDLDPYGSPKQFIDGALQAIKKGGLMCITCTDMGVLCGNSPEKCWASYGSMPVKSKACHEMALRIVLSSLDRIANRYSKYVEPLLCISQDFYVRLFVIIQEGPLQVKDSVVKQSMVYMCTGCSAFALQPIGRVEKRPKKGTKQGAGSATVKHHTFAKGPTVGATCQECNQPHHIGGPIWNAPLQNPEFLNSLTQYLEENKTKSKSSDVLLGKLQVLSEELHDVPLYYVADALCGVIHVPAPTFVQFRSAFLNLGYRVSLSHAAKQSIKTDAPPKVVWDILRVWAKKHPCSLKHMKEGTPCYNILSKQPETANISFEEHPDANPKSRQQGMTRFHLGKGRGPSARPKQSKDSSLQDKSKAKQGKKRKNQQDTTFFKQFVCKKLKHTGSCPNGTECKYSHDLE